MRTRSRAALLAAAVALAGLSTSACGYIGMLKAKMAFKDANTLYQPQDYKKAIEKYKEALEHKPDLAMAYFYLGNSYDNLYKPARKGEAANDANLQEAIDYYRKATETITDNPKLRKLSLRVPARRLRQREAQRPLAGRAHRQEDDRDGTGRAEELLRAGQDLRGRGQLRGSGEDAAGGQGPRPKDATAYMQLAGFYNRQGRVRQDDRGPRGARRRPSRTTPRRTTRLPPTLGQDVPRLPAGGAREARVPGQGRRGRRTGPSPSRATTSRPSSTRASCSGCRPTWRRTAPSSRRC